MSGRNSGKYVCTASNVAGEAEIAAGVVVLSPPSIAPGQISYNLIQGNSITLPCEAHGEPQPKITWQVITPNFTIYTKIMLVPEKHHNSALIARCF